MKKEKETRGRPKLPKKDVKKSITLRMLPEHRKFIESRFGSMQIFFDAVVAAELMAGKK